MATATYSTLVVHVARSAIGPARDWGEYDWLLEAFHEAGIWLDGESQTPSESH